MKILKFGGSSLATADCIRRVFSIVGDARRAGPVTVVVSAFGGVTNDLAAAADSASRHPDGYRERCKALYEHHVEVVHELAPPDAETLLATIEGQLGDLADLLHGVFLLREASPRLRYLASLDAGGARVALTAVPPGASGPFAGRRRQHGGVHHRPLLRLAAGAVRSGGRSGGDRRRHLRRCLAHRRSGGAMSPAGEAPR